MKKYNILLIFFITFFSCNSQSDHNCSFPRVNHQKNDLCGYIEVPKNRSHLNDGTLKLAYLVKKSKSKNPHSDPVIFLQGGPGGSVLPLARGYERLSLDEDRDFILFDQRGTGYSDAICANLSNKLMSVLSQDLSIPQEITSLKEILAKCNKNHELSNYNSLENAADIEDLRKHLGYKKLNLFGGSYGTRVGLTYMNLYPEAVRSSILVGLFPPNVRMYDHIISNFDQSLNKVFKNCEEDPYCNQKYPDLRKNFTITLKEINENPLKYNWNGKTFTMNSQDFLLFLHQMLYNRNTISRIPSFIMAAKNQKKNSLSQLTNVLGQRLQYINLAVYWSVMAGDEGRFDNKLKLENDLKKNPKYGPGIALFNSDVDVINGLVKEKNSLSVGLGTELKLNIPTLLISGGFDPITPYSNAVKASKTLSSSHIINFEYEGHMPFNPCFFRIASSFLDNPSKSPDGECTKKIDLIKWQ